MRPSARTIGLSLALLLAAACAHAARPGAPLNVRVEDDDDDDRGTRVLVSWRAPEGPAAEDVRLVGYQLMAAPVGRPLELLTNIKPGEGTEASSDQFKPWPWRPYDVAVAAVYAAEGIAFEDLVDEDGNVRDSRAIVVISDTVGPVRPVGVWFNYERTNILLLTIVISAIVLLTIYTVRGRAEEIYIRPIAGLEAVNDAVGRATEMGKPMVYVSGLSGIGDIATIASMLILGHLSRRAAAYETDIIVPCNDPMVMVAEREIVRQAYSEAGKPDAYRPENIWFVTDSQFGYVAAVDGIMMRERPAACFYMGYFFAEALILAETGNQAGAIQIAGTDADTQLPFFITACDYTLMGEELYAASAYLSRQPLLVAQLRGQDIAKAIIAAILIVGVAAATYAAVAGGGWLAEKAAAFVAWFTA